MSLPGSRAAALELALFFAVFLTVALFIVGIASLRQSDRLAKRLQTANGGATGSARVSLRYGAADRRMARLLTRFVPTVSTNYDKHSAIRRRLIQAGYYDPNAVRILYALRAALAFVLTPVVLVTVSLTFTNVTPLQMTVIGLISAFAAFYLPMLILMNGIQKRQQDIRNGLPDALDLLLVCVEAGLGLDSAINRVAIEIAYTNPVLSEQLRLVALEFQAGKGRSDALRNLAARTGVDDVKSFVTLLVHSDKLGTSMAQSLRIHATEMRTKRLLRAEEKANKLPVKVVLPIGLFFLPCLLVLIFTPLAIRVIRVLMPALGGG